LAGQGWGHLLDQVDSCSTYPRQESFALRYDQRLLALCGIGAFAADNRGELVNFDL
jgi:hypothetical protein